MQEEGPSAEELNAFVDGELDEARAAEIAAEIAAAPALARRVAALKADKERLGHVYGRLIDQPLSSALVDRVRAASPRPPRTAPLRIGLAAALAAAAAVVLVIWLAFGNFSGGAPDPLVAEALAARQGGLAAESSIGAASLASVEARDRLVAQDLGAAVKVPDLRKAGYDLDAITVYPEEAQRHSLQLEYRNGQGRIFTVFLAQRPRPEGFNLVERGRLRICIWQTEELSAVMVGEMSTSEMLRLASLTYADLNF